MKIVTFDVETFLTDSEHGSPVPKLVCLTYSVGDKTSILGYEEAEKWYISQLQSDNILVGANTVFDTSVMVGNFPHLLEPTFKAYKDGRMRCVQIRQQLIDIACGHAEFRPKKCTDWFGDKAKTKVSLQTLAAFWLDKHLEKEDTYRLRYGELADDPIEEWPTEAVQYALEDAKTTLDVWLAQERFIANDTFSPWRRYSIDFSKDEIHQNKAAWILKLMSVWGIRTDPQYVQAFTKSIDDRYDLVMNKLKTTNVVREKGTKDLKLIRKLIEEDCTKNNIEIPKTDKHQTSTKTAVLKTMTNESLLDLASISDIEKIRSTWLGILGRGTRYPIHTSYNVLLETGRTSSRGPNMQNPPRNGGVREAFVPRPGYLFAASDYDTLELRSLAYICYKNFGSSKMRDALIRGEDLHLKVAAEILGIEYKIAVMRHKTGDPEIKKARQLAKVANFGFPGGMGPKKLVVSAGISNPELGLDLEMAYSLQQSWFKAWPEMGEYFKKIGMETDEDRLLTIFESVFKDKFGEDYLHILRQLPLYIVQEESNRIRGGVTYCSAANSYFQGLAADGAKQALWDVGVKCYMDSESPLFGSRIVIFLHDELILEVPESHAHEATMELKKVMEESMAMWIKGDIPITCTPALMRRWYKGAEEVIVDGKIRPCKPVKEDGKLKWVEDLR